MTQKTGIEMIEDLVEMVSLLDRRFTVIEQNMKELLNRSNGFGQSKTDTVPKIESTISENKGAVTNITMPEPDTKAPSISSNEQVSARAVKAATNTTRVMGKIKNKEGKALIGVSVTILKENGETAKQTKTNRAGDWMCFLPVGRYKARYFMDKMINAVVQFSVDPSKTSIRVAQPKWE